MLRYFYSTLASKSNPLKSVRNLSSSSQNVITKVNEDTGVCTISMNSAPVNSLDGNMLIASAEAVNSASTNKTIRGIVLKSQFDGKVFSAGLNIMDMFQKSESHYINFWTCVQDWYLAWYSCSKPVVAAINGHAPAGGCALSMMCDYRVMMKDRTIGLNETKLGITAPFFFVNLMLNTIGHRATEHALETGNMFSSEQALQMGLVDKVVDLESVVPTAENELLKLMSVPLPAFSATKQLLRNKYIQQLKSIKEQDAKMFATFISQEKVQRPMELYLKQLKKK